jgi:VWFA-related protein
MKKSSDLVMSAAKQFVEALRPDDALGVETFADRVSLVQDLSKERARSLEAVDQYKADGGTALYDALADAFVRLSQVDGRRAVVVVTDGKDENNPGTAPGSVRTLADDLRLLRTSGAIVYAVGVGTKVDRPPLEELARESGGQAYFPSDASELPEQYARIVENLRRRFVVSYTSTNGKRDGTWRKVAIHAKDPSLVVSSAGGYYAPEK